MQEYAPAPDAEFQKLVRSKYAGNPRAMTALAARLMVGRDSPFSPADGLALLNEAACQDDAEAWCYLAVMAAAGVGRDPSWADAFDALSKAADLAHAPAVRQRQLLGVLGIGSVADIEPWFQQGDTRCLHESPRYAAHSRFLPPALCNYLIEHATPRLKPAQVFDARGGGLKVDPMRTNTGAAYSVIDTDVVMQLTRARIARTAGVAFDALEPMEVLHYSGGEMYRPHVDFFHASLPNYADEMRLRGQRIKTCLVYLNAGYEGGETDFPKLGIRFRGEVGEALIFDNVGPDGVGDMNTLHTGLPPTRGEKWLLSQWIRERRQPIA
ncbi:MAG TPA: 2OG-Fe(II) oxygenase, partial [Burkholderiales bacterium]|nr:2OG-Fe(II) oxygenase [Burkholderiales bacterium]